MAADGEPFTWQLEVTDARLPQPVTADGATQSYLPAAGRPGLRQLSVEVTWQKGPGDKRVSLTTYMAENGLREGQTNQPSLHSG